MKVINIDSVENIKVVGFDVFYVDSEGNQQKYTDGLIDIAKGELSVLVNGSELDISKVVDAGENVAESLNNAFLENTISSSQGNTAKKEAESEEKVVDELLEKQKDADEQLEFVQQQLQERLAEIERLEKELEEQKDKLEEEEAEEEIIDLEALFPAASAGETEEEITEDSSMVLKISMNLIKANKRKNFLCRKNAHLEKIFGHKRYKVAQKRQILILLNYKSKTLRLT